MLSERKKNRDQEEGFWFFNKHKMQGQQPVLRQTDQSPILPGNIVIKMSETIQPITTVGKYQRIQHASYQTCDLPVGPFFCFNLDHIQ